VVDVLRPSLSLQNWSAISKCKILHQILNTLANKNDIH
jgi:hypothetical protein